MKTGRPDQNQLGVVFASHKARYDGAARRMIYDLFVREMHHLGIPPTHLAGNGPGLPKRYASFKRVRKRVEATEFGRHEHLSLKNLKPERDVPGSNWAFFDWTATAGFAREDSLHPELDLWCAHWTVYHIDCGVQESEIIAASIELARRTVRVYGYIGFGTRLASMYAFSLGVAGGRGMWHDTYFYNHAHRSILRDVYAYNFLSRPYLALPIEGLSLEQWVLRDPDSRGSIEPFADAIWLWKPPPEHIPSLRETLFRAGHILYYYFFDPSSRHYRDWTKPFVPVEPIPDVFRAETYAGQDPRVIA